MRTQSTLFAIGAVLIASSAASAQFFVAEGDGTYTITTPAPPSRVAKADLSLSVISGPFGFSSAVGEVTTDTTVTPATLAGSVTLTTGGGDELVIDLSGLAFAIGQPFETAAGEWTYQSGTGVFAGLTGEGAWNFAVDFSGGAVGPQPMTASFGGTLIPSPAPIALLSLGFGAFASRRRR